VALKFAEQIHNPGEKRSSISFITIQSSGKRKKCEELSVLVKQRFISEKMADFLIKDLCPNLPCEIESSVSVII